jgi:hypothetical protein
MEKLEQKQVLGYLPFGLKIKKRPFSGIEELTIRHLLKDGINDIIPILHPLSDYTKEIKVNGKNITPCVEIMKIKDNGDWIGVQYKKMNDNPHYIILKFYEWHLDIDNLIGKKLAIDINTL